MFRPLRIPILRESVSHNGHLRIKCSFIGGILYHLPTTTELCFKSVAFCNIYFLTMASVMAETCSSNLHI